MDTTLMSAALPAFAALLGGALTAYVQTRTLESQQSFQVSLEAQKLVSARGDRNRSEALQRLQEAHLILSQIQREFSVTTLDILWRKNMTDEEYDERYLASCRQVDTVRALFGLHEPAFEESIEKIYGQMNLFWGNFNGILRHNAAGTVVDHRSPFLENSHAAAAEIGKLAAALKGRLADRAEACRKV